MSVDVSERAFEDAIEASLLQHSEGVIAEERASYMDMPPGGYQKRRDEDYNRALCLIPRDVLDFVLATQPQEWKRLSQHHGAAVEEQFLKRLSSEIGRRGALDVLRNGIRDMGCRFRLAYFRPASGLNEETRWLYQGNTLLGCAAAPLQREQQQEPRPGPLPQRHPHLHGGAQEPAYGARCPGRHSPVPDGP